MVVEMNKPSDNNDSASTAVASILIKCLSASQPVNIVFNSEFLSADIMVYSNSTSIFWFAYSPLTLGFVEVVAKCVFGEPIIYIIVHNHISVNNNHKPSC